MNTEPVWKNFHATIIQNCYRHYLKCERDPGSTCKVKMIKGGKRKYVEIKSPMDPIYKEGYDEKHRIRIVEWGPSMKKGSVWHFNINSLIMWLNQCMKWTNPLTNISFRNKSINLIISFIAEKNIKKKLKLKPIYNTNEPIRIISNMTGSLVTNIAASQNNGNGNSSSNSIMVGSSQDNQIPYENGSVYMDLLKEAILAGSEVDCFNLLNNNYEMIADNIFKIDSDIDEEIIIRGKKICPVGVIHLAIFFCDYDIVHHLAYFGCNLEKRCGGYTPIHLAAILNLPDIGKILKMYGADVDAECVIDNCVMDVYDICEDLNHGDFIQKLLE